MSEVKRCAHCGRVCGDFAGGYAAVNNKHVCHPNAHGRPDCYRLVTVYHEPIGALRDPDWTFSKDAVAPAALYGGYTLAVGGTDANT